VRRSIDRSIFFVPSARRPPLQTLLCKQSTYFTMVPVESYAAIQEKYSREFDLESSVSSAARGLPARRCTVAMAPER
jgi:hypothetical protein